MALVDPLTGMTSVVRAGHPEPVLRAPDGSCSWLDTPGGLPLGLNTPGGQPAYPVFETVVEPGSTLVLCTDGLIESRAEDIDQGRERLLDALEAGPGAPDALADHLLDAMAPFTGEEDDVALLVLHRTRGKATPAPRMEAVISPTDPDALRNARIALREALHSWSLEALSDTAELLACELATNALVHTDGSATLTARPVLHSGRGLRLAVSDTSTASPRRRAAPERATSGRGIMLIEELATAWGVEPRGNGKTVWCELSLDLI
jgi:hypothetical protein